MTMVTRLLLVVALAGVAAACDGNTSTYYLVANLECSVGVEGLSGAPPVWTSSSPIRCVDTLDGALIPYLQDPSDQRCPPLHVSFLILTEDNAHGVSLGIATPEVESDRPLALDTTGVTVEAQFMTFAGQDRTYEPMPLQSGSLTCRLQPNRIDASFDATLTLPSGDPLTLRDGNVAVGGAWRKEPIP